MRKFILKVIGFLLLQVVILIPFWNSDLPGENNYLARTIDKHKRLRHTPAPRLILVGGSNLTFGIRSELLEKETGIPVVNMALGMPLGIEFMLDDVEDEIAPGDVVLLSFEYAMSQTGQEGMLTQMVEFRPQNFKYLAPKQQKRILDTDGLSLVGSSLRRMVIQQFVPKSEEDGYKRQLFDERGSYVGHYGRKARAGLPARGEYKKLSAANQARIEKFARTCRERGAVCFYTCPAHPACYLEPPSEVIEANIAVLGNIPGLQLLDVPQDHAYPANFFYDSVYHLTEEGATERTVRLVKELRLNGHALRTGRKSGVVTGAFRPE